MRPSVDKSTSFEPFQIGGKVTLFGFDPTSATARLRPRQRQWRLRGTVGILIVTFLVAPCVVVVPPHVPWVLGVLATGIVLARRRWTHRFTLEELEATCPRCGTDLRVPPGRLRVPQPLTCESCRNDLSLVLDSAALAAHGGGGVA